MYSAPEESLISACLQTMHGVRALAPGTCSLGGILCRVASRLSHPKVRSGRRFEHPEASCSRKLRTGRKFEGLPQSGRCVTKIALPGSPGAS